MGFDLQSANPSRISKLGGGRREIAGVLKTEILSPRLSMSQLVVGHSGGCLERGR